MTYPSAPVDAPTQDTLALIDADPSHRTDRELILDAIETEAAAGGGVIDPNRLRDRLHGLVQPQVIGSTINSLARRKVIAAVGWTVTTGSTSGNDGRPCRVYAMNTQTPSEKVTPRSSAAASEVGAPDGEVELPLAPRRPAAPS